MPIAVEGQDYGLTQRPNVAAYLDGKMPTAPPIGDANWSAVIAFPNVTFQNALGILPMPGTNKLVVWEREGRIYSFENDPAASAKTLMLDIHEQCQGWDDTGLLGLAFHPDFENNHYVYIWYNWVTPGTVKGSVTSRPPKATPTQQRLVRYTVNPATGVFDPASEYILISQQAKNLRHNGGGMFFHPDNGFLYLTIGNDYISTNDQTITRSLFGGVFRIDVDKRGADISHAPTKRPSDEVGPNWPDSYYIPNDNPFVGITGAVEEFFALGLRSPHRMTFDPMTGRIFIGDVGENSKEEVDVIEPNDPAGLNFQWNRIEGYGGDLTQPYIGISRRPVLDYTHGSDGYAVIGGYVYRGAEFPELLGKYIFADNVSQKIWMLDESTHTATTPADKVFLATLPAGDGPSSANGYTGLSSFGLGPDNELYICQLSSVGGYIFKLQRGGPPPSEALPATLSETGVFSDTAALTPSDKLIPYTLNHPFWSDGAVKSRWAAIPSGATVGFQATGEWTWPEGSVLVKHFELPVDDTNPAIRKRLETRLLVKMESGAVYGATYKWRADNSDADLIDGSHTENVPVTIASPGMFTGTDIGSPSLAGSTTRTGDRLEILAGGSDIQGASDQFHFAWQQRSGDFDISVRIESLTQANLYTKAGLMARESLAAGSRNVFALAFPGNATRNNNIGGFEFQYRSGMNGTTSVIYPATPQPRVNYPNTWLRLRREGDVFTAYSSEDGASWREFAKQTLNLPDTVYFGAAVTSHATGTRTTTKIHLQNTRLQPWYYPSRVDCLACHTAAAGGVLGPKTRQLNGNLLYPNNVTDNQLRSWSHIGLFDTAPTEGAIPTLDKLAGPNDTDASLELRARSYLDANCASCHRPGGGSAFWDARFDTPLNEQKLIYGALSNNLGDPQARVVVPQSEDHSMLYQRINRAGGDTIQMPPIAKNVIDQHGVDVIRAWINSIEANLPPFVRLTAPANGSEFVSTDMPVTLKAQAFDTNGINKVEFYDGDSFIGVDDTSPFEAEWYGILNGTHSLTAVASDRSGNLAASPAVVTHVQSSYLPPRFSDQDIGSVGVGGATGYENESFLVDAAGTDIWGTADGFRYIHRTLTGNGEIIARVASLQNTDPGAKAGVMFRETLDPGSRYAFSALTPGNGLIFHARITANANATEVSRVTGIAAPHWVRLVRIGNSFQTYHSSTGQSWTPYGSPQTVSMNSTVYAGIAVTSRNNSTLTQAIVDHLTYFGTDTRTYDLSINFQPAGFVVPDGYAADTGLPYGVRASGLHYGWDSDRSPTSREIPGAADPQYNTFLPMGNAGSGAAWEIRVPNGTYEVRAVAGDPISPGETQHILVEGQTLLNGTTSTQLPFIDQSASRTVTDGCLTVAVGSSASSTKICFLRITSHETGANLPPKITLTSPPTGSEFANPASIVLEAEASDSDTGIARVEFLVGGTKIGEDLIAPYSFAWNSPAVGSHEVSVRAVDIAGGSRTSPASQVTVKTSNDPPVIFLYSPASSFTFLPEDTVTLSAEAGDVDGGIARVEFWVDGSKLGESLAGPYHWNWTGPHDAGSHTVHAIAYDDNGESSTSASVTIQSQPMNLDLSLVPGGGGGLSSASIRLTVPLSRNYVIEWSDDLVQWHPLDSGTGSGSLLEFSDSPGDAPTRFYRVRITN